MIFLRAVPGRRLVILPVAVLGRVIRYDTRTASDVAQHLRDAGLGSPQVAAAPLELPFEPQPNEQAIFWSRFIALADSVRAHPRSDVDYVLLVDVFGAPERHSVPAVHAMIVTGTGEMAYRGAWNSHHPLYKEFKPATLEDAGNMVVADITRRAGQIR